LKSIFKDEYTESLRFLEAAARDAFSRELETVDVGILPSNVANAGEAIGKSFAEKCGVVDLGEANTPATVFACISLLEKCIKGDATCLEGFAESLQLLRSRGIVYDPLRDSAIITDLLIKLGINIKVANPISAWIEELKKTNPNPREIDRIQAIESNAPLMALLNGFVVTRTNPAIGTSEFNELMRNTNRFHLSRRFISTPMLHISDLKRRNTPQPVNHFVQIGGGEILSGKDIRLFDYLKNNFIMTGGGSHQSYVLTAPELKKIYDDLNADLRRNGKEILEADRVHIEGLYEQFARLEKDYNEHIFLLIKLYKIIEKGSKLDGVKTITLELLRAHQNLEESAKSVRVEYDNMGAAITDILKCIKEGCAQEEFNKIKNSKFLQTTARIADLGTASPRTSSASSPRVSSKEANKYSVLDSFMKYFSW
jgi:hypothetical protein